MKELTQFKRAGIGFLTDLQSSIECFRKGEDRQGLDCFQKSIDGLQVLLEHFGLSGKSNESFEKMMPVIQTLNLHMQNQDITGMIDLLEFTLYPLANKWIEECDN